MHIIGSSRFDLAPLGLPVLERPRIDVRVVVPQPLQDVQGLPRPSAPVALSHHDRELVRTGEAVLLLEVRGGQGGEACFQVVDYM